jgi:glycogen(starch) synthase
MKITFLTPEYPPFGTTGGIGSYVSIIAPTLAARGHEVRVITCTGSHREDVVDRGVDVHVRPFRPIPLVGRVRRVSQTHARLAAARSYSAALRELGRPDVVESPEWMAESLRIRGSTRRSRLLVHLHTPVGFIARHGQRLGRDAAASHRLEILSIRGARAVTSPSRLLLDLVFPNGAPQGALARVIRQPVDLGYWKLPEDTPRTERVVLVVGRLERLKGVDTLLEAAGMLPPEVRDTTTIVAVGRSSGLHEGRPYAEWLSELAERLGVRFEQRTEVARNELAAIYPTARVVALPSRFDNFPMVALEAMASGRPVVCSSSCGAAELVGGSGAGEVFATGDTRSLSSALLRYLTDEAAARVAGDTARALVEAECAPDVIAGQREQLYRDMASA